MSKKAKPLMGFIKYDDPELNDAQKQILHSVAYDYQLISDDHDNTKDLWFYIGLNGIYYFYETDDGKYRVEVGLTGTQLIVNHLPNESKNGAVFVSHDREKVVIDVHNWLTGDTLKIDEI